MKWEDLNDEIRRFWRDLDFEGLVPLWMRIVRDRLTAERTLNRPALLKEGYESLTGLWTPREPHIP